MAFGNAMIGNLAVNLSMETATFNQNASKAEARVKGMRTQMGGFVKSAAGMGAMLAGGVIIAGLTSAASGAFEMASALTEAAQKVGLTVEALQELRFAAGQTGVSNDQLDAAMIRLNKTLGELQLKEKGATAAFKAIGLSAADLKGKTPDQALRLIADALNKIPDPATRVALGSDIMGKGFSKLLPLLNGGSKALEEYANKSRKAGQISTEDAQRLDDLADNWETLKTRVGVATAKIISATSNFVGNVNDYLISFSARVKETDAKIAQFAKNVVSMLSNMVTSVKAWVVDKLNAIWATVAKKIDLVKNAFANMYDAVVGHSYVPDMIDQIRDHMLRLDAVMVAPAKEATTKAAEAFRDLQGRVQSILSRLFPEATAANQFNKELADLKAYAAAAKMPVEQLAEAIRRLQSEGLEDPGLNLDLEETAKDAEKMMQPDFARIEGMVNKNLLVPMQDKTAQVADAFANMAINVIGSVRGMIDSFKSGDILSGLQGMLSLVSQVIGVLGQAGVIKLPSGSGGPIPQFASGGSGTFGGRSGIDRNVLSLNGSPIARVSKGEQFQVTPANQNSMPRLQIVPSPYFDVVVDGRARNVAAPMAGQAAVMGVAGSEARSFRQARRRIP